MSRSINEIQQTILDAKASSIELSALEVLTTSEQTVSGANSTSKVAVWRLWVWIVAFAQFVMEKYWETFKAEMESRIASSRIHTPKWYRQKALDFMLGKDLVPDKDYYDTTGMSVQEIANAKIVSNAATVRVLQNGYGTLRIKVVGTLNNQYAQIDGNSLASLNSYFNNNIADAGTLVTVTSGPPDLLKLELDIYYNPLILGPDGKRLDQPGLPEPTITQIENYLKSIDFENGKLVITHLVDKLQQVPGIVLPVVRSAYSKYGNYDYNSTNVDNVGLINEIRLADSGYMKLDEAIINYKAYTE